MKTKGRASRGKRESSAKKREISRRGGREFLGRLSERKAPRGILNAKPAKFANGMKWRAKKVSARGGEITRIEHTHVNVEGARIRVGGEK